MYNIFTNTPKILINRMQSTIALLEKARSFTNEKGMTESDLLGSRLAPDMLPFVKQIQIMTDNAKGGIARLTAQEAPKYEDNEQTIDELVARLEKTIEYVKSNPINDVELAANQKASFGWMPGKELSAGNYVVEYLIPNFHFHATIAYAILRNLGMQIGKTDFLSKLTFE